MRYVSFAEVPCTVAYASPSCAPGTRPIAGQQVSIYKPNSCWNQLLTVGGSHLRLKEYNVDTTDDQSLDLLLVHKVTKEDVKMESPAYMKTTHSPQPQTLA